MKILSSKKIFSLICSFLLLFVVTSNVFATTIIYAFTQNKDDNLVLVLYHPEQLSIRYIIVLSQFSFPSIGSSPINYVFDSDSISWNLDIDQQTESILYIKLSHGPYENPETYTDAELLVSRYTNWSLTLTSFGDETLLVGPFTIGSDGNHYQQKLLNSELAITRDPKTIIKNTAISEDKTCPVVDTRIRKYRGEKNVILKNGKNPKEKGKTIIPEKREQRKMLEERLPVGFTKEIAERLTMAHGIFNGWIWLPSHFWHDNGCDAIFVYKNAILFSETKGNAENARPADKINEFIDAYIANDADSLLKKISSFINTLDPNNYNEQGILYFFKYISSLKNGDQPQLLRGFRNVVSHGRQDIYQENINDPETPLIIKKIKEATKAISLPTNHTPCWEPAWEIQGGDPEPSNRTVETSTAPINDIPSLTEDFSELWNGISQDESVNLTLGDRIKEFGGRAYTNSSGKNFFLRFPTSALKSAGICPPNKK